MFLHLILISLIVKMFGTIYATYYITTIYVNTVSQSMLILINFHYQLLIILNWYNLLSNKFFLKLSRLMTTGYIST